MNPPADMPEEVVKLVGKCWEQKPENRPSFEEVYGTLHGIYKNVVVDVEEEEEKNDKNAENVYAVTIDVGESHYN